jgi:DeoR/GlpR family transcriptional regulator of sugar metabolism
MLPIERQQQILTWLEDEGILRISDISNKLGVSEMTVYRDIKPLINQNKIMKTSRGITFIRSLTQESQKCTYCFKNGVTRHAVQIITNQQTIEHTCCPHCGLLRYGDIQNHVSQILCRDFLNDITISAKIGHYLIGADYHLNCCHPQVLVFSTLKHAEQFQTGFGGQIFSFNEAIAEIPRRMSGPSTCHCD